MTPVAPVVASGDATAGYRGAVAAVRYGDESSEWEALDSGAGLFEVPWRATIVVGGGERARFLHGQLSNHIEALGPGRGCPALLLSAQGKVVSLLSVYHRGPNFLLVVDAERARTTREALASRLVADDVELGPVLGGRCLGLAGPRARVVLGEAGFDCGRPGGWWVESVSFAGTRVELFSRADLRVPCFEIHAPSAQIAMAVGRRLQEKGARWVGTAALEIVRIESGTPAYGLEFDEDRLALEARLEWAIHPDKGCYLGQEVVERTMSRGRVNRRLCLLGADGKLEPGDRLKGGGETERVTSAARSPGLGYIGLAYLPCSLEVRGTKVAFAGAAASVVEAVALEWPRDVRARQPA